MVDTCTVTGEARPKMLISVQDSSPVIPIDADATATLAMGAIDVFNFADDPPTELEFGHFRADSRRDFL